MTGGKRKNTIDVHYTGSAARELFFIHCNYAWPKHTRNQYIILQLSYASKKTVTMAHLTMPLACVGLLLLLLQLGIAVEAQFYMYTPGESIEPYVTSPFDSFGGGFRCTPPKQGEPCFLSPYFDRTLCFHEPANVSMTPWIEPINMYGDPSASGTILVRCGSGSLPSPVWVKLTLTINGTLPDVSVEYKRGDPGYSGFSVPFSPSNPFPIIVARCQEPGLLPSRIAYARRIHWVAANGSYCPTHDVAITYHELTLPRCLPSLVGDRCDGQSIVAMPNAPTLQSVGATSSAGRTPSALTVLPLTGGAACVHFFNRGLWKIACLICVLLYLM